MFSWTNINKKCWNGNKRIPIKSIVHVTGGSFRSKLGEDVLFSKGFSTILDNLFYLPDIMQECATWRKMTYRDVCETWNTGQGALAIVPPEDAESLILLAETFDIYAQVSGRLVNSEDKPSVTIYPKYGNERIVLN